MIGVGGVEQRDRVAIPQQLTVAVANQNAVDIRTVGAEVVQIDPLVFVRAADLAVLVAARTAGKWRVQDGGKASVTHRRQDHRWGRVLLTRVYGRRHT